MPTCLPPGPGLATPLRLWGLGTHEGASPQTLGRSAMKPEFKTSCRGRGGMEEEEVEESGEGAWKTRGCQERSSRSQVVVGRPWPGTPWAPCLQPDCPHHGPAKQ